MREETVFRVLFAFVILLHIVAIIDLLNGQQITIHIKDPKAIADVLEKIDEVLK